MGDTVNIIEELSARFGPEKIVRQETCDEIPTLWTSSDRICEILSYLKTETDKPYQMLYDLTAVDERVRSHRYGQPDSDFTVVYHLL